MKISAKFWSTIEYLPNRKYKKPRTTYVKKEALVDIKELTEKDFPTAFIVHDYNTIIKENGESDFSFFSTEIKTHNGKLFKALRYSDIKYQAGGWAPILSLLSIFEERKPYSYYDLSEKEKLTDQSIILSDNTNDQLNYLSEKSESYIIYDDKIWRECGEPMYNITTFGLGHNHGGTGFFISYHYNPNISYKNYFNALQRDEAIKYGKEVALGRGDTESVEGMGDYDIIEVLMPEMVKRNPVKDHGDGDPFLNSIESLIEGSRNKGEAALLSMALLGAELSKGDEK